MAFTRDEAIERARQDLAERLSVAPGDIKDTTVTDTEFPDMALGAARKGEMSGQMITPGWRILLSTNDNTFEYRANTHQLRLLNYQGENHKV